MGKKVFANGMEIAAKAGSAKVIAAFPDVCMSPPPPPAGPVPVPYPNTSKSSDLKKGSKKVKIGGKPISLKSQSYYKTSPLGNEAATRNFGAAVVTHQITGKTYFQAYSMDVKVEGKNVNRHLDITTSNHGSMPGNTPPMPNMESMSLASAEDTSSDEDKCPCCGEPRHANQKDPDTGLPYAQINEQDWYDKAVDVHDTKVQRMHEFLAKNPSWASQVDGKGISNQSKIDETLRKQAEAHDAHKKLREARNKTPPCENLHNPPDTGCGTHMVKTNKKPNTSTSKERGKLGFKDSVRRQSIAECRAKGHSVSSSSEVCHKTALAAGGCPSNSKNLIPKDALSPECKEVDDAQTLLQGTASEAWCR